MKIRLVIAGGGLLLGVAAAAWWWQARTPQWNIVLVTLDTTRADYLGCYGDEAAVTPNLDRLAGDGVLFERAYTVVPITLPAHGTILTGLLPPEHGLRINGTSRLPDSVATLAELLGTRGYRTGAFVSSLVLDSRFGLDRGFDVYDDNLESGAPEPRAERPAAETVSSAIRWLTADDDEPLFCWIHLYDPHEPYDPHRDEFEEQFAESPYRGELAYMDGQIGRLLQTVSKSDWADRTIVVVAGDHGEGLGEHQESTHGYLTYNSTLHVPLLVRHPELPGGVRVPDPVSLVDLFPTILDALDLPTPSGQRGRSLMPCARGSPLQPRPCYAESEAPLLEGGWSPLRTWMTDRWKYIDSTIPELYDLESDPRETENLFESHPDEAALLMQELADFEAGLELRQATVVASSDEQLRALRGLGYAGGQAPLPRGDKPLRDIKEMLPYAEKVHHCMHLIDEGDTQTARQILEEVVASADDYPKAWGTLGVCLSIQRQFEAAEKCYRRALELDAGQNFARIGLGRALFETGRLQECVEQLQTAVEQDPAALDAQYYLGEASRRLGRWDLARAALSRAIELEPTFSEGQRAMADLERDAGNLEQAAEHYRRALSGDPRSAEAALGGARVLSELGRDGEAMQMLSTLLQAQPQHVDALCELAQLLATTRNDALRDPGQAVALAAEATRLSNRRAVRPLRVLAIAQAAAGRSSQAVESAEAARDLANEAGDPKLSAEIEIDLAKYREQAR